MHYHFRFARCAGGEEHERRVISARGIIAAFEFAGIERILRIEVVPAVFASADEQLHFNARTRFGGFLGYVSRAAVCGADNGFYACCIEPVFEIVLLQKICRRYRYRAELMESDHCKPELAVAL